MRATPPRRRDFTATTKEMTFIRRLIETATGAYLRIESPSFSLTLQGEH